jgi:hypothetical protein
MKRSTIPTASLLLFLLMAVMALGAGCVTVQVIATSDRLIGAPVYPPTDPATVQIVRETPTRPYEKLGEIFIEPSSGFPPREKIEEELRREGARFGADAVLILFDRTQPTGKTYTGGSPGVEEPIYGHAVRADAISYKRSD